MGTDLVAATKFAVTLLGSRQFLHEMIARSRQLDSGRHSIQGNDTGRIYHIAMRRDGIDVSPSKLVSYHC